MISFIPFSHAASCYYRFQRYFFKIENCEQLALGKKISLFGSVSTEPDTGILSQKRLVNVRIVQGSDSSASVYNWLGLFLPHLFAAKRHFLEKIIGYLPITASQLSVSMLFGDRGGLTASQQLLFEITGTQHLLAASGYHVGIVLSMVRRLVQPFKKIPHIPLLVLAVWIYAVLAGFRASVIRAAVMHSLALGAGATQRLYTPLWGLGVTLALLLVLNPWYATDVGFQLSVAATTSILLGARFSRKKTPWDEWVSGQTIGNSDSSAEIHSSTFGKLREYVTGSVRISLLAQVGTLPVVLYHFGSASLWGVVATSLVSWLMPVLMVGTVILGTAAVLVDALRITLFALPLQVMGFFIWLGAILFLFLLSLFDYLPRGSIAIASVPWPAMVGWWGGCYLWFTRKKRRKKKNV